LLRRRARKRASANERKALKKFEAITEKSIPELKLRQKSRHSTKIKRQANLGLEGILREGRGRGTSPSLIKKNKYILTALN